MDQLVHEVVDLQQQVEDEGVVDEMDDLLHLYIDHELHSLLLLQDELDELDEDDHELREQIEHHEQLGNQ